MSTTPPPRVLLADDHTLVLEGFRRIVEQRCEVVGAVEDGRALLEAAVRLRPDLILLDISMPLLNGVDAGRQLKKLLPEAKLIFVTMHADPAYVSEAFKAGASAYLLKRSAARELDQAIEAVLKGQYFVTSLLTRELVTGLSSEDGGCFHSDRN
ncbi:MAG: response regulator transcription factor [Nitrospira sp.]|nr:response regulator transcription factor [Nitrospira sp.]